MITVQLTHGLGNQLFQYSAGRSLSHRWQTPLVLDISRYGTAGTDREYALGPFAVQARLATGRESGRHQLTIPGRISRKLQRSIPIRYRRWIVEPHFTFDPELLQAGPNSFLEGFWQSEKYFGHIRPLLLNEIRPAGPPEGLNAEMARRIAACTAVSVHVRRGDFVTNPRFGVLPIDYYHAAFARMAQEAGRSLHYFVFSDDHSWVREHFGGRPDVTVVDHNREAHEDFRLMSLCRHHIIANSTFSWWSAWISAQAGRIVIAPARWVVMPLDTSDLLPPEWIRL